ncbi:MAG: btuB 2 [Bacteroidetes bacterium]|jgi:vitamin B12 transporter|nr:btuB 2 [Bacteroidota bacterium]
MKKEKCFIAVSTFLCLSMSVSAQDSLKKKELKEVVITATRSEQDPNDVGRSISVITSEEIKRSGATSVAELLTVQEGMYAVGAGQNPGLTSSIFTRGANSNQTVILIDGVRITDPSAINNAIDVSELSLANISKIEIVRGSHSTLYGSAAIGGVINIITKKSEKAGLSADVSILGGTFGNNTSEISENVYLNYALKNGLYVSAELYNTNVQGMNATEDTVKSTTAYKHSDMSDDFDKLDWLVKAGFNNKKIDVYASFKQTNQFTEIDKGAYRDDDNYTLDFKRNLFTFGASYKVNEKLSVSYIGGMSDMKRIAIDDSSRINSNGDNDRQYVKNTYKGKLESEELQANYKIKGLSAVVGGGVYSESMRINTSLYYYNMWSFPAGYEEIKTSVDSVDPKSTTGSIFMHADIGGELINDKYNWLNLSGGLRYSDHSIFGSNITYEINPSFKITETALLYMTYSTGYNAPSLYQLYDPTAYKPWDGQPSTGLNRGNKKLNPETSKTFEVGFKQRINNIELSAAYYKTVVENVIEYVYLWDKNIGTDTLGQNWGRDDYRGDTYINAASMTTEGVELGISSKISGKITVSANLSLTSGKLKYTKENIDTAQTGGNHVQIYSNGSFINDKDIEVLGLSRRPNTANISLTYRPITILMLRADVRYVGGRGDVVYDPALGPYGALGTVNVKQYTLLDLSANVKIWKGLSAGLRVANVLDEKYSEINGFRTRGRSFYLNVRYSL